MAPLPAPTHAPAVNILGELELWTAQAQVMLFEGSWLYLSGLALCCRCLRGRCAWAFTTVALLAGVLGLIMPGVEEIGRLLEEPVQPEPAGLAAALQALPARQLSPAEREALDRDGVLVVRGVIRNKALLDRVLGHVRGRREEGPFVDHLLEMLRRSAVASDALTLRGLSALRRHLGNLFMARYHTRWLSNGAVRAVLRDGPLGSLASSAMDDRGARILLAQVWDRMVDRVGKPTTQSPPWHRDDATWDACSSPGPSPEPAPLLSVWLAITDAPAALEFVPGSHLVRDTCRAWRPVPEHCQVDPRCVQADLAQNLSRARGKPGLETLSMQAGDVVVFRGLALHRGIGGPRTAICVRFVPADYPYMGSMARQMEFHLREYWRYKPRFCGSMDSPLFPVVHPRENSTMDAHQWPVTLGRLDLLLTLPGRSTLSAVPLPDCRGRAAPPAKHARS